MPNPSVPAAATGLPIDLSGALKALATENYLLGDLADEIAQRLAALRAADAADARR